MVVKETPIVSMKIMTVQINNICLLISPKVETRELDLERGWFFFWHFYKMLHVLLSNCPLLWPPFSSYHKQFVAPEQLSSLSYTSYTEEFATTNEIQGCGKLQPLPKSDVFVNMIQNVTYLFARADKR